MSEQPRRRYGEKEVGTILKRAAELQRKEPVAPAESAGVSLTELQEIAAEAGIDPKYIRQAATELEADPGRGEFAPIFGAPLTLRFQRVLDGELPTERFEDLIPDIQSAAEAHGQVSAVGRTLTWQSGTGTDQRTLQVIVSARDGRTRILIEERLHRLAAGLFGGIVGGVGGGVGLGVGLGIGIDVLGSVLFSVGFPALVIGGSYLAARFGFAFTARRRHRILRDLLDRLTERIGTSLASPAERLEGTDPAPELPGTA